MNYIKWKCDKPLLVIKILNLPFPNENVVSGHMISKRAGEVNHTLCLGYCLNSLLLITWQSHCSWQKTKLPPSVRISLELSDSFYAMSSKERP